MTEPIVCGHPTPNGPCTRKVLLHGAGGCGYHPAPPDPPEERNPEPMASCECERPLVLGALMTTPRCAASSAPSRSQSSWPKRVAQDRLISLWYMAKARAVFTSFGPLARTSCRPWTVGSAGRRQSEPDTESARHAALLRHQELDAERRRLIHDNRELTDHLLVARSKRQAREDLIRREPTRGIAIDVAAETERRVRQLTDAPPPLIGEGYPNFDGGVRESAPPPSNPVQDHNGFLLDVLEDHRGGGGVAFWPMAAPQSPRAEEANPDQGQGDDWRKGCG